MKITPNEISIKNLTKGYEDNDEEGVVGYSGKLDIRPRYQRNFVYDEKKRNAVIDTVKNGYPLNAIYWADKEDGSYEVIDGQQRIISICQYIDGVYSINGLYFHSLQKDEQDDILNYKLLVYFCSGSESQKLKWFETINISGVELTPQELKNAVFSGPWVTDAKRYFSKRNSAAHNLASAYLDGDPNRQIYLETAIKWISDGKIKEYMSTHHHADSAKPLWDYFEKVIEWIESTFTKQRSFMKGLPWGFYYNKYKDQKFDSEIIEKAITELIKHEDKIKLKGIYEYILTGDQRCLSPRKFPENIKNKVYEKQNHKCKVCSEVFDLSEMEADHRRAWFDGGETTEDNCDMLCRQHHYEKTATQTKVLKQRLKI